jgi:hypothetical protein
MRPPASQMRRFSSSSATSVRRSLFSFARLGDTDRIGVLRFNGPPRFSGVLRFTFASKLLDIFVTCGIHTHDALADPLAVRGNPS